MVHSDENCTGCQHGFWDDCLDPVTLWIHTVVKKTSEIKFNEKLAGERKINSSEGWSANEALFFLGKILDFIAPGFQCKSTNILVGAFQFNRYISWDTMYGKQVSLWKIDQDCTPHLCLHGAGLPWFRSLSELQGCLWSAVCFLPFWAQYLVCKQPTKNS